MHLEGLYIHIPFCKSKCSYCDFYSKPVIKDRLCFDIKNYTDALKHHIEKIAPALQKYSFDTVYFGGGTPSILGESLAFIYKTIKENLNISKNCEVTFEANPESVNANLAKSAFSEGFNRVSLGLQSAVDGELNLLGRIHTKKDFENAVKILKNEGFKNISADIMLSIPNQTIKSLENTLNYLISLDLQHISAYGLKIEKNTPFYKNIESLNICNEETQREMYLYTVKKLENAGFYQYEISNFAKKGFISKHNYKYWTGENYLGIGPFAYSFLENKRFFINCDIQTFENEENIQNVIEVQETLSKSDMLFEYIMLGLRLKEGITFEKIKSFLKKVNTNEQKNDKIIKNFIDKCKILQKNNLGILENDRFYLTPEGFLISNSIINYLEI